MLLVIFVGCFCSALFLAGLHANIEHIYLFCKNKLKDAFKPDYLWVDKFRLSKLVPRTDFLSKLSQSKKITRRLSAFWFSKNDEDHGIYILVVIFWIMAFIFLFVVVIFWIMAVIFWIIGVIFWIMAVIFWIVAVIFWIMVVIFWIVRVICYRVGSRNTYTSMNNCFLFRL